MKKSWEIKKLGEVCEIELGKTPYRKDKSYWDTEKQTNNVWLSISDLLNTDDKFVYDSREYISDKGAKISKNVKKGTLLLSFKLTIGRLAFAGRDLFTNEAIAALTIKHDKEIDKFYLYNYLIFFDWDKATEGENKVKGKTLNKSKLKELEIIIPPLPEQKRIVALLDRAFKAIDQAKANAEKNLQNAQELFDSYLNRTFEKRSNDWEEKKLGEVIHKTETINPKLNPEKEFIYIDVSSVNKKSKIIENTTTTFGKNAPSRARKLVKTNDVIFATVRPTHQRVTIISDNFNNQVCSTGYYVLRAKEFIHHKIIYYFILTYNFNEEMKKLQKGASYPAVTNKDVEAMVIHFPKSIETQKQIVAQLDQLQAETKKLEAIYQQKLDNLEEIKKSLLQKAFKGELTENEINL